MRLKNIMEETLVYQNVQSGTSRMKALSAGKAALTVMVDLGAVSSMPGELQAQLSPALSAVSAEPAVTGAGIARCERVAEDGRTSGDASGHGRALHQAWNEGFLTVLNVEQSSRQAPTTDQGAMSADAQWTLLPNYYLRQPDDLFVHAVAALAGSLNHPPRIARNPRLKGHGVSDE